MATYRPLEDGEIIKCGDEYRAWKGNWLIFVEGTASVVGNVYYTDGGFVSIRRKIETLKEQITRAF